MILLTLWSAQVFTHNSSSCHGNSSSPITISRMVMLALYPCGSLDKVMLLILSLECLCQPKPKGPAKCEPAKPDGKALTAHCTCMAG